MAIRRFRAHIAEQNWFSVLIDIGIVVLGVFLGIQASNWNSARIERGEVRASREQIIQNMRSNEIASIAREKYFRQVRGHAVAALRALEGSPGNKEEFLVDLYQASQSWPVRMERGAYDEMVVGGMAKGFGSPLTRQRLSSYYAMLPQFEATITATSDYRERVRREMKFEVQQRLRERCNDVVRTYSDGFQLFTLPKRCSLGLPAEKLAEAARQLEAATELELDLTRHIGDLDQKIALLGRRRKLARELRLHLEQLEG